MLFEIETQKIVINSNSTCSGFFLGTVGAWNKGPNLTWISNEVDIILLVETWEHEEYKFPNIDGFVPWSIWNRRSYYRGIGGMAFYIRKNVSPHARIYKKTITTNIF